MQLSEIHQIKEHLRQIEEVDIPQGMANTWPNQDLAAISVGNMNAAQLISLIRRVQSHLEGAMEEEPYILPRNFHHPDNVRQQVDILSELQIFLNAIRAASWGEAAIHATLISQYLMYCGQWGKAQRRAHAVYEKKAADLLSESSLKVGELSECIRTLKAEKDSLVKEVSSHRAEFDEVRTQLDTVRSERTQISELLKQANNEQGQLSGILQSQTANFESTKKLIEENKKIGTDLGNTLQEAKQLLQNSNTDSEWISGKKADIDRLTGGAADGSLGGTFRTRKDELNDSVKTWRSISLWATILAAIYIPFAFLHIPSPHGSDWLILVANLGKITPVLVFLGFVFHQYSRERAFLEEYAFKASVAFVVNAYADQVGSAKIQKNLPDFGDDVGQYASYLEKHEAERRTLMKETVSRLFEAPKVHIDRPSRSIFPKSKDVTETIREIRELVKEVKE